MQKTNEIGRPIDRVDGRAKVMGAVKYSADLNVPNQVYGAIVESVIARGAVRSIDSSAAMRAPGVLAVMTHENAPRLRPLPEKAGGVQLRGEGGMSETYKYKYS